MIGGMHTILYSKNADAVRGFFRDVLRFPNVDAGQGWLIFAAPPAEIAVHPTEERSYTELYMMCADLKATMEELKARGVEFPAGISEQRWGLLTQLKLPDGELLGLYEPRHPMGITMKSVRARKTGKARSRARKAANGKRRRR